ncbi:formamidopyrimidine-DNA glycosylase [Sporomusaceae bacterium BoRhaA]|uniref:bifunctional DNA-formamidopyrimidine glycosylase/DNA-(apurinic or apyrimidinic site) lyase n=1 Tax=Pelorhabdus rhamnosifermentans TaxID=2772457 RepID=UPI001C060CA9|nr:bifunctional DNA-formamidopyrimidine glycosylase/DNA-(apurinic or apyrimidinic site) lyase [Pelorhabdus rhamnosifermentans]MBU2702464.1 formamidopyrimidine-DNA glycosylase [Pelorhabdus rhamnosifermentans]
MPEMPEVETIRRQLADKLLGHTIMDMDIRLSRLFKWPEASEVKAHLIHQTIVAVTRRGKYLLFTLSNEKILVVHLRMTGRLLYQAKQEQEDAYTRIVFYLENKHVLIYADTRTLGTLYVMSEPELARISGLATMGPEPCSAGFTREYLSRGLAKRHGNLKALLLNQQFIGGLGNIYVDECLAVAGISPERKASSLLGCEVDKLYEAVNRVIQEGLEDGGTTFRDYQNSEGKSGSHQDRLWVYDRTGQPCRRCGTAIMKKVVAGRGTHYCPHCQH